MPNIDKETDNWECLKMAIGSKNWCNLFDKSIWHYLVEINKHIPYAPVTEFTGIHPKGIFAHICEETCSIMFIEALFIVEKKKRERTQYLSIGEKMAYSYRGILCNSENVRHKQHASSCWIINQVELKKQDTVFII